MRSSDPGFADHFSAHAALYAAHRPSYPPELFALLAAHAPARDTVWDCATGSGQAAVGLAAHFARVVATDASASQLTAASSHPGVSYAAMSAESAALGERSVDAVTVAQAAHWFRLANFYEEVERVARPNALVAIWMYNLMRISPKLDARILRFYQDDVGAYWPGERRHVDTNYAELEFPFTSVELPPVKMTQHWTLAEVLGYVATWSAVQRCRRATGRDPIASLAPDLATLWGAAEERRVVTWPLHIRAGTVRAR
jgi:ubiquinone/menaquinone biosynthesis C-methylase UbiE